MRLVRHLCLIGLLCLAGCADTKYRPDAMTPIAAEQARIVFFRNGSFIGADLQASILYDGSVVGNSTPSTYFYIDTTPGRHDIATTGDVDNHLALTLAPGETRYVKTGLGLGQSAGRIEPELVSAERALRELPELTFAPSGPTYVAGKPGAVQNDAPVMPPHPSCASAGGASCAASTDIAPVNAADTTPQPMPGAVPMQPSAQSQPAGPDKASDMAPEEDKASGLHLGTSSNSVEELARREKQCEAIQGAELVSSDGPIEYYREQCKDGRVFRAKCQFRQCVEIDSN